MKTSMPRPVLASAVLAALVATQLATPGLVQPAQAVPSSTTCASTLVIAARGTDEPSGYGRTLPVVRKIRDGFRQTVRTTYLTSREYPATGGNYPWSVGAGERSLRAKLNGFATRCPRTWVVLVGYSQGAHVIGDVLDVRGTQLSSRAKGRIKAVVLLGDPTFRANQSYSAGTYDRTKSGIFRRPAGDFGGFTSRIKSYCNRLDRWCQNNWAGGAAADRAHADYAKYATSAFNFAKSRY